MGIRRAWNGGFGRNVVALGAAALLATLLGGCGPVDVTLDDISVSADGNQVGNGSGHGSGGSDDDPSRDQAAQDTSGAGDGGAAPASDTPGTADTPDAPSGDPDPSPAEHAPVADAGANRSAQSGDTVTLDGSASADEDGDALTFAWAQTAGTTVTLSATEGATVTFVAPEVDGETALTFVLTVSDGLKAATAEVVITVEPATSDARITAEWRDATQDLNIDIDWVTPDGQQLDVQRSHWGRQGAESVVRPVELLADGVHTLLLQSHGDGAAADVSYRVRFPGFRFDVDQRLPAGLLRIIGVEIADGVASCIFNGWLDAGAAGAAELTRVHGIEVLAGWRNASGDVNLDIALHKPDGQAVYGDRMHWLRQGFERITLPADVTLEDGTYRLDVSLAGGSDYADVTLKLALLDVEFALDATCTTQHRVIGIDVTDGTATVLFNEWLPATDPDAGALTGRHPLEVVCGWRDGTDDVNADISLRQPDGKFLWGTQYHWDSGGFERVSVPRGIELQDGVYEIEFALGGDGRFAEIDFAAAAGDWSFARVERLGGGAKRTIQVRVTNGVVEELTNTWKE